ncbi:serine/threonine-protein phosphatase 6 regulatory ankyrin repeat subunit B-like [Haliotis cracherodii]|uniref:serine/threonine-protein phosphatase 6 regulatory ankyrin repeat subunit B-like n=1 Tax=Haliotis cracherodii TaxID=6455 RepID=UPI0039EBD1E9
MEGNPDSRGHQMTGRLTEEAADLLRRTEQGRQLTSTSAIQHNYSGPVSQVDLTNATNVSVSVGEQGARGCLSQERYCQKVELLKEYFVDIHALQTAQQLLEKHGHVSICGAPGDGKTSIALKICEAYQQKRYETVFVENIERFDVDTISKRQSHMLVVFDDIFGSVTFSSNLEKLHELFIALVDDLAKTAADTERDSKKNKDKQSKDKEQSNEETPIYRLKLVFTSRTYIWKEGCSRLHQYKVDLLKTEAMLDMTKDHLTVEEKKCMLRSFKSKHPECDISEKDICSITDSKHNIFGFPLISRLFFTHAVFQMHNVKFFNNPLTYLRGDLDAIVREESNRSAAILLLILCDGNLNLVSLQSRKAGHVMFDAVKEVVPCCTSTGIAKEITNFTGVYCTVEDHIASFSHPSIYDAAACAVGHLNIVLLLEHCSLKFLYERVRLGKGIQSSDTEDVTNMIYITPQLHQTVVDRLVEGIRQGCFIWTVTHSVLRDERIASLLWTEINDNIVDIVEQKDRDSGECFLYSASLSESYFLFSKSLEVVVRQGDTSTDLYDCVVACVTHGKLKHLEHLVTIMSLHGEFDVEFSIDGKTLLIMTAKSGQSEVFNFLIHKGADISVTDWTGSTCLHYACESGSMALTRKVVEMGPVLLNSKSFVGLTPAMLCAKAGHIFILKFLKQKGADLTLTDYNLVDCLHLASENGNLSTVRFLISLKMFNVNKKETSLMQTSAMKAAEGGHYDVYHLLVSEGADLTLTDKYHRDCLMLACKGGNISIVKHVLSMKTWDINRRGGELKQTPVMMALEGGHYDVYHLLVSEGADLNTTDKYNRDCLMLACVGGNISIVKHVLSMKTWDINRRGGELKQTPVMMALEGGHYDVYHLLVSEGADLNTTDKYSRDCLMLACVRGNISIVKHVLSMKTCDINGGGGEFDQTPVKMALKGGHYDVYHLLVSEGADLTLTYGDNRDCLMLACEGGNLSIVKHVLSMKTWDINRQGRYFKKTLVMMALERGQYDVYHLLVSEGADLTIIDEYNKDCLMLACEGGNISIVKHVLSMKTWDINRRGGYLKQSPVMIALERGHYDVYHLLVSEGADLTLTDEYHRDCLSLACEQGNISIVKHVLSMKTCDITRRVGKLKQTPVMMALERGHYDVYHLLVSEGAYLNTTDEYNRDCLMLACEGGNISMVKHVLSMKTWDINRRGGELKQTPVMMALERRHYDVYHLLVSEGADLTTIDEYNRDCLMLACEGGNISIVKHVLSMKTWDINRRGGELKQTPVMRALERRHYDVYHLLVSEGADLTLTCGDNRDCLILACEGGNTSIVKHVLSMKTCNINRRGGYLKQSPVMIALERRHYDVYHLLVSEGANLTLTDEYHRDCLMLACKGGTISIVKHVLSMKTCDINRRGGKLKQTPVMMALEERHYDVCHLLVSEGADLTITDAYNKDCLMLACEGGNISIVKHVLSMKTCNINRQGGVLNQTPVMMAVKEGHYDVCHLLVSEGADLTLTDEYNRDCLMLACEEGNISIVKHVLSMKTCDINRRGGYLKQTPIMMALERRHYAVYHLLVSERADLTLTDVCNSDCLSLACKGGNIFIVKHVLSMKTWDINRRRGSLKDTPVMMALEGRHYDVYHLLVSEGADLTLTDHNNSDCLLLACMGGNISIVKHVLSMKTCDINRRGGELKQTPVMRALERRHYDVYHLLVSEGADLTLNDKYNRDCLMLACEGGNISIVKHVLSMKTWDINRRGGYLKQTPIMMALERGHYDVYHLLVSEGADLTLTDVCNRDCLMLASVGGNISIVKDVLSMKTLDINRRGDI